MTAQAPNAPDMFATWKDLYDRVEATWTQPMQEMLGSERFAAGMSANREQYLTAQETMREAMEEHLKTLRLPTKTDHARMASQIVALEAKIERLEDRLERMEDALQAILAAVTAKPTSQVEVVVPSAKVEAAAPAKRRRTTKTPVANR